MSARPEKVWHYHTRTHWEWFNDVAHDDEQQALSWVTQKVYRLIPPKELDVTATIGYEMVGGKMLSLSNVAKMGDRHTDLLERRILTKMNKGSQGQ